MIIRVPSGPKISGVLLDETVHVFLWERRMPASCEEVVVRPCLESYLWMPTILLIISPSQIFLLGLRSKRGLQRGNIYPDFSDRFDFLIFS